MQLLVASDLHYALPQLDWILDQAVGVDAVVLAGDLLDVSSPVPLESQIVVIRTYLRNLAERTTTVVCSGNHDLSARNGHGEKSAPWIEACRDDGVIVDGQCLDVGDVRITVCPWWDGPATRADVASQLERDGRDRPRRWVWIYHYPPTETPVSWVGNRYIGDDDLHAWIHEHGPDLVLTGHIHDSPFLDGGSWIGRLDSTWVINAGRQRGPVPTHAIVDLATGLAEWWSPFGRGDQRLWSTAEQVSATS